MRAKGTRPKIDIIITSRPLIRTWVSRTILGPLTEGATLRVLATSDIAPEILEKTSTMSLAIEVAFLALPEVKTSRWQWQLHWINNLWHTSYRQIRLREYLGNYRFFPKNLGFCDTLKSFRLSTVRLVKTVINPISLLLFFPLGRRTAWKILKEMQKIEYARKFSRWQYPAPLPDYVLIPSLANDSRHDSLLRWAEDANVPSIIVIENWDNLTSKAAFATRPSFITCMGGANQELINKLHGGQNTEFWAIGLPKFDFLPKKLLRSKNRIYYLGYSQPHDELSSLIAINEAVRSAKDIWDLELIYRPHPHRLAPVFSGSRGAQSHFQTFYHDEDELIRNGGLPALGDNYERSLEGAMLVVGPPTTMILEACLVGVPTIVDCIDDKIHRSTAGRAFEAYSHMKELSVVRGVEFAYDLAQLKSVVNELLAKTNIPSPDPSPLVGTSVTPFSQRLLDKILSDWNARSDAT